MWMGQRIKKIRKSLGLTQEELASKANISRSYLADVENNRYNPSFNTLEKIAEALGVSTDRLTGESASSIIEDKLEELDMPLSDLAEKARVPLAFLVNLDNIVPDIDDLGGQYYDYMTRIAKALRLQPGILRAALARQETPAYDNSSPITAAEAFSDPCNEEKLPETNIETVPVGNCIRVPIIGTVTAGPNGLAYEDYQGEEWVDTDFINGENLFYLKIKGDSMTGEGILPGDLALVRETPEVRYGGLAIAIVDDEEGTIKRVYKNDDSIILQASNPKYPPQVFKKKEMERVRIIGEVRMTVRNYY